jgi:hypothetical protein
MFPKYVSKSNRGINIIKGEQNPGEVTRLSLSDRLRMHTIDGLVLTMTPQEFKHS